MVERRQTRTVLSGAIFTGASPARRSCVAPIAILPAILSGLKRPKAAPRWRTRLTTRDDNHVLKLYQPVHQILHVALVQAFCDTFGYPRLDAPKIDSSGLVVRRVNQRDAGLTERWSKRVTRSSAGCRAPTTIWIPTRAAAVRADQRQSEIDRRLALPADPYNGTAKTSRRCFPRRPTCATPPAPRFSTD